MTVTRNLDLQERAVSDPLAVEYEPNGNPKKRWVPSVYVDEVVPPPRETPSAWLMRAADGAPMLAAIDSDLGEEAMTGMPTRLADGQVVEFGWRMDYGRAALMVRADGTWTAERDMPPSPPGGGMMCAIWGDWDTVTDSLKQLVEDNNLRSDPGEYIVCYYAWSDEDLAFRYDAAAHCFHEVAAAGAEVAS